MNKGYKRGGLAVDIQIALAPLVLARQKEID
jgi:hypothetical protein